MAGTGTALDPWLIESTADLQNIGKAHANSANWADGKDTAGAATTKYNTWTMAGYYKLTADLDWATHHTANFKPIGHASGNSFTDFSGHIDGDGHSISNILISQASDGYVAFIASLRGSVTKLKLLNISATGNVLVGGIAGSNQNTGVISYCSVSGAVSGLQGIGGIAGYNEDGANILFCKNTASITASGATSQAGGIAGYNEDSSIVADCYSEGTITGSSSSASTTGGLIGGNIRGIIRRSYSTGSVPVSSISTGGLVGGVGDPYESTNNFFDYETADRSTSATGTAKTTSQMKTLSTFTGWDIVAKAAYDDEVWFIDEGNDYPRLGWENAASEPEAPAYIPRTVGVPSYRHIIRGGGPRRIGFWR